MEKRHSVLLALPVYYRDIHEGVALYAREHGWHLHHSMDVICPIGSWRGNGVITQDFSSTKRFGQELERLKERNIPVIRIGKHIRTDDEKIGIMAADHLMERGFWNIAWFAPNTVKRTVRLKSFEKRLMEVGGLKCIRFAPPPAMFDWDTRLKQLREWLLSAPKPLGVFCVQDTLATQIIDAAISSGLRIPEDVAVLGVDNDELVCETSMVPISSVETNLSQLGFSAARLLDDWMNGKPLPNECLPVAPKGVESRHSTDVIAVDHQEVAKAVTFIRHHFRENINIDTVVSQTTLSQRGLYKAFHKYLKCSIGSMIAKERIEYARKLLLETNLKISDIAYRSGFRDTQTFYPAFKRRFGMSPRQWRQKCRDDMQNVAQRPI